jgi:hypothetical protein
MPAMMGKEKKQNELIATLDQVFRKVSAQPSPVFTTQNNSIKNILYYFQGGQDLGLADRRLP